MIVSVQVTNTLELVERNFLEVFAETGRDAEGPPVFRVHSVALAFVQEGGDVDLPCLRDKPGARHCSHERVE